MSGVNFRLLAGLRGTAGFWHVFCPLLVDELQLAHTAEETLPREWGHKPSWGPGSELAHGLFCLPKQVTKPKFKGRGLKHSLLMGEYEKSCFKECGDREEWRIWAVFVIYHKSNQWEDKALQREKSHKAKTFMICGPTFIKNIETVFTYMYLHGYIYTGDREVSV